MGKAKVRFDEADSEVYDLMQQVLDEHFPEITGLADPLRITILMASNGGRVFEPCLKLHGAACVAMIEKTKPEERALGGPDLRIKIDANRWAESNERRRKAILSHECRHIGFDRESEKKGGGIKYDAYDRPKVKFWKDDWVLSGFHDVCEWYGQDAVEYQAVCTVQRELVQLGLPFPEEEDRAVAQETASPSQGDVIRETFASLLSVGHTESQAREAIERVTADGRRFRSVAEMIEAIYADTGDGVPSAAQVHDDEPVTITVRRRGRPSKAESPVAAAI